MVATVNQPLFIDVHVFGGGGVVWLFKTIARCL